MTGDSPFNKRKPLSLAPLVKRHLLSPLGLLKPSDSRIAMIRPASMVYRYRNASRPVYRMKSTKIGDGAAGFLARRLRGPDRVQITASRYRLYPQFAVDGNLRVITERAINFGYLARRVVGSTCAPKIGGTVGT